MVARRLAAADAEARDRLLPLLAATVGPEGDQLVAAAADPAETLPPGPRETVIADYTRAAGSTPIMVDAAAWGRTPVPAGQPVLLPAVEGLPRELRVELDPTRLSELRLAPAQVIGAIQSENAGIPAGVVDTGNRSFSL